MNARSILLYVGIALTVGAATRLSIHMGLTGFSIALPSIYAVGILLVAREPTRQLSDRIRVLESKLQEQSATRNSIGPTPAA
jgi:hypothetical protein